MQLRAKELSRSASVDLQQKVDDLAKKTMILIDIFDGIYEVAKQEGYPIDEIIKDKEYLKQFLMISNIN